MNFLWMRMYWKYFMGVPRQKFLMSMHMYFALFLAREMVLLIWIFTLRRETAGELGSPG